MLDTLTPPERLAFVLHDTFAVPFEEIAPIVDRTPAAARQLASRARRRVHQAGGEANGDKGRRDEVVGAFIAAGRARGAQRALIDGAPGAAWAPDGEPRAVVDYLVVDGRIVAIEVIAEPEHVAQLDIMFVS